jgi:glycosyltransferase involved in cell wall biosynthesis/ribosomal protein S18 acetylase RimI-like enzyme
MRVKVAHIATVDLTHRFLLLAQLRRLRDEGYDVTAISAPGPWTFELEAEGIRFVAWPHATRAWSPGGDVRAFVELVRILHEGGFDLVQTHNPKPGILGRLAACVAGIPCVVNTVHGFYAMPGDPAARRFAVMTLERIAGYFSDLELYQSKEDMEWSSRARIVAPSKRVLLGNGIDVTTFAPDAVPATRRDALRAELGIGADEVVVGSVGRLVVEKGYRELFSAAEMVRQRRPHVRFLVVGGLDPEKADAVSPSEIDAAAPGLVWTGWRDDVRDLMAVMDVFVLPSWREGMPRSAIEASAMGLPLVVTDIRGCREVVRAGAEGKLVPVRDPARLAEGIAELADDLALRDRMGRAARARAVERFDERKVANTVVQHYADLLRRRSIAPPSANASGVSIRRARPIDARVLARIHAETMPRAFLPGLGHRFLTLLYRSIVTDPGAVTYVAQRGREVLGFASGTASTSRLYKRFVVHRGLLAATVAAPKLARRDVRHRLRESGSYANEAGSLPDAELLSIAVVPEARARRLGRSLADAVLRDLADLGVEEVKVLVGADNVEANAFYERVGFRHVRRSEVHAGIESNVWVVPCRSLSRSSSPVA